MPIYETDWQGKWEVHEGYRLLIEPSEEYLNQLKEQESEPVIATEPIDEEKAFLSEAVIQLSSELEVLKQEIKTLKGGN